MTAGVAHTLATPIPVLLEMEWDDLLLWNDEALRLFRASRRQ